MHSAFGAYCRAALGTCIWAVAAGVARCKRYGQGSGTVRTREEPSVAGAMLTIDIMQWCLPPRRQHAGIGLLADEIASGASGPQEMTHNTRLAISRCMGCRKTSTGQSVVTIQPLADFRVPTWRYSTNIPPLSVDL